MYERERALSFLVICSLLGIDPGQYKRSKNEWVGKCPFHQPKNNTTSFWYHDDGRFHCFACEAKGRGAIDFVKRYRNCSFTEAVGLLSPETVKARPETPQSEHPTEIQENSPFRGSYEKFYIPCDWLDQRIPNKEILYRFGVGCYSNPARKSLYTSKIMLPILRLDGQKVGYLARNIAPKEGEPKYIFPKGFLKHLELYGVYELGQKHKVIYLVESPFCVLKFATYGLPAVSPLGWSVAPEQIAILKDVSKGVIYLPDTNKYEQSRQVASQLSSHLWTYSPPIPTDDPEQLTLEQIHSL